ncbi:HD domain-containing protein [Mycobacterium deserti]|uniref:HD domain-containing protein n=1 Tax=Mycobacterium deserti TaxID=2978347 RepID=A0ABT2MHU1_9MYCO|nr:HD domain-containing protein [Mycobacterium deserti]MCT7661849.1 HD domain-containing protein [Mycobacterium deserti]
MSVTQISGSASAAPPPSQNNSLALPDTPLTNTVLELIDRHLQPAVRNHSLRGFLFGRERATAKGLRPNADYDEELMFLICALHDIGLAEVANGDQRFEMDGADYAANFLEANGVTDARVDALWDAIAAHTSGLSQSPVYRRRRSPEIWTAVDGIALDLSGSAADFPAGFADLVHAAYPRLGGAPALFDVIKSVAMANPMKAPPGTLPGELVRARHPELSLPTIEHYISANGWGE